MGYRGAIIVTWGGAQPGITGAKSLEIFAGALGYYDELQKQGRISGYRVYSSTLHAKGSLVIEGELEELAKINVEEETLKHIVLGSSVVQDLTIDLCIGGSADDVTGFYGKALEDVQAAGLPA